MSDDKHDGRGKTEGSKRTQFRKGGNANPKGRGKGTPNTRTIFNKVASEKFKVREGDKVRAVELKETIIREDLKSAARGKNQAVDRFYKNDQRFQPDDEDVSQVDLEEDKAIIVAFLERYQQRRREGL